MTHSMTWADFYLICFAVGFCFSFFSFVLGSRARALALAALPRARWRSACYRQGTAGRAGHANRRRTGREATRMQQAGGVSPFNLRRRWRHSWRGLAEQVTC